MKSIDSTKDLAAFRQQWTGSRILDLLSEHRGRVLVDWAVGVGKSFNIDRVIECAIREDRYDLVVMLAPTRRILNERAWIQSPPPDIAIVNLRPRPAVLCGTLDNQWREYERNNLGGLGRQELCGSCGNRPDCYWPDQYGSSLAGSQVVYATQAHLERSPVFLLSLKSWCRAQRVLVILDEVNFVMKPARRRVTQEQLQQLLQLFQQLETKTPSDSIIMWRRILDLLLCATTRDLETGNWHTPFLPPDLIYELQAMGRDRWGDSYCFIGYELQLLGKALADSREINAQGALCFSVLPQIPGDFLIYSGATDHKLTQHRLGNSISSPFADYRFFHPKTRWYNIASRIGARKYFRRNSDQILDFFSRLIADRLQAGKRILLVAKKLFLPICRDGIQNRLRSFGLADAKVVIASDSVPDTVLQQPHCIPLINFGMVGTNRFEHIDCCYCLTGFYVEEKAIHDTAQDLYRLDIQLALEIGIQSTPLRRYARVRDRRHRYTEVTSLAQATLDHLEMGCVIQAVGRVRPSTKPREVITFQCAEHPEGAYYREFPSLGEARAFFQIPDSRTRGKMLTQDKVQDCKSRGLTQRLTAATAGLGLRTVKRHWNLPGGCHESS